MVEYLYTVGVCMITYNHELFIAAAIEGVMKQETNFSYHLYIGDDCSTDNTRDICLQYKNRYPHKITLLDKHTNLGMSKNFTRTLKACKSKFIALCEGDDYWTDPYKLQKQVDFMEDNPDYAIVYHRVKVFYESLKIFKPDICNESEDEKTYTIEDLSKGNFMHTPSVLFRANTLNFSLIKKHSDVFMDYFLWMTCSMSGRIKYLPDIMSVYRVWDGSVWELKDITFKMTKIAPLLTALLKIFSNNEVILYLLFNQLKNLYKTLWSNSENKEKLDEITKKLLVTIDGFQVWWFAYMIHIKETRKIRLKYFFYLLINNKLSSFLLIKKCFY